VIIFHHSLRLAQWRECYIYSVVALRARKSLLKKNLPSIEQRKLRVIDIVRVLQDVVSEQYSVVLSEMIDIVDEIFPPTDVFILYSMSLPSSNQRLVLAELQMRFLMIQQG